MENETRLPPILVDGAIFGTAGTGRVTGITWACSLGAELSPAPALTSAPVTIPPPAAPVALFVFSSLCGTGTFALGTSGVAAVTASAARDAAVPIDSTLCLFAPTAPIVPTAPAALPATFDKPVFELVLEVAASGVCVDSVAFGLVGAFGSERHEFSFSLAAAQARPSLF